MGNNLYETCDKYLLNIKQAAMDANFEPDVWFQVENATQAFFGWANRLDHQSYSIVRVYLEDVICKDMLLSFIISMQGNTDPIAYRTLQALEDVDKKWVGPYDEEMTGNLIECGRAEINNCIYRMSYLNMLQFFLGLIRNGYFDMFQLEPDYESTNWVRDELKEYLISGAFMDTDEHSRIEFQPGIFGRIHSDAETLCYQLYEAATRYIIQLIPIIRRSTYDHNSLENRMFAREKMSHELTNVLANVLINGNIQRVDINWLKLSVVKPYEYMNKNLTDDDYFNAAMSPICDIVMRTIFEGHIMSGLRMANMKTMQMVIDTIMLRRNIENEFSYIKYQDDIGNKDTSYAGTVYSNKGRTRYAGQGMWR